MKLLLFTSDIRNNKLRNFKEFLNEAKDVVTAHYKNGQNVTNIFYNTKTGKVWLTNQSGVNVAASNLMFKDSGSYREKEHLLVDGIKVTEPTTDEELAYEVGEITDLGKAIKPGKG